MITEITINEVITDVNLNVTEIIDTVIITINDIAIGVASGGTTGQVLAKKSNIDFDTEWVNQSGGGGAVDSVNGQTGVVELGLQEITDVNSTTNNPLRVQVGTEYSEIKEDGLHLKNNLTAATAHLDGSLISADIILQVPNQAGVKVIATDEDLDAKQDTLVSGTNIKTINGESILGTGDLEVGGIVPDATDTVKGIAKLYPTLGSNTDGSIDQATAKTNFDLKAPLTSPTFTGTPLAPTATAGTNNTQIATTAYVDNAVSTVTVPDATDTFLLNGFGYHLPNYNSATYAFLKGAAPSLSGAATGSNGGNGIYPENILYSSGTTIGTVARQSGVPKYLKVFDTSQGTWSTSRRVKVESNIATYRIFVGVSNMYSVGPPTNVSPTTMINTVGICKLATSNNWHVIHNSISGTATTIDLGSNFPANNVVGYWYIIEVSRDKTTQYFTVTITRYLTGDDPLVSTTLITTNIPMSGSISSVYPVLWITNNDVAVDAQIRCFGFTHNIYS